MESNLRRAVRSAWPKIPNSGHAVAQYLDSSGDERFTQTIHGEPFYMGTVENDGQTHIVFCSHETLTTVLEKDKSPCLHLDGSFKTVPNFMFQLLIGLLVVREKVGLLILLVILK
jgi:hypothetical protein